MLLEDKDAVSYGAGGAIGGGVAKVLARSGPGTSRGSRWVDVTTAGWIVVAQAAGVPSLGGGS